MPFLTVKQVAALSGVTVRTLHHYDAIGLLRPASRSEGNYRRYGETELLRLQQILLYREMGLPLAEIGLLLDAPAFDLLTALEGHRTRLLDRQRQAGRLLRTIDRTIQRITKERDMLTDEELYDGLSKEQIERYNREVDQKYDPERVAESRRRVRNMSREQWEALKAEGGAVFEELADLMDRDPADPAVQALVARHHAWIERFYDAPAEVYRGLGQGYAAHPDFRAFFDKIRPDLADFLARCIAHYADTTLASRRA